MNVNNYTSLSSSTSTRDFLTFLTFGLGSIITSSSTGAISFKSSSIGSVFTELDSLCSSVWTCAFTIPVINCCACFLLFSIFLVGVLMTGLGF